MSSRLEKQDANDVVHSLLALAIVGMLFFGYYIGAREKQKEIENRALQLKDVSPDQERVIELVIFGELQE